MGRKNHGGTPGIGGSGGNDGINCSGRLEVLADGIQIGDMHEAADGFIRANELIEGMMDDTGNYDSDEILQVTEDAISLGARLARTANGRAI